MLAKLIRAIKTRPLFYLFILVFCIAICISQIYVDVTRKYKEIENKSYIEGEIYREPWNKNTDFILRGDVGGEKIKVLVCAKNADIGEIMNSGYGALSNINLIKPASEGNFYAFDYCKYLKSHRIDYLVYANAENIEAKESTGLHGFSYYSWRIRLCIENCLSSYFTDDFSGWIMSIMTGDTGGLESSSKEYLSKSGFSHLVAVSGAHIAFVSQPFSVALKRSLMKLGKRNAIMLIPVFLLWFIAGATPSVTRAVIMCFMSCAGVILKKRNDALNSLGLAGIIQIIFNPFSVFATGFVLSYLSTASILILLPIFGTKKHNPLVNALLPGICVNLGMLPISIYLFNSFSICGFIVNAFAAEIASILCVGGYIVFILDKIPIIKSIVKLGANALVSLSYLFEKTAEKIGGSGAWFFRIELGTPSIKIIALYYLILLCVILAIKKKKIRIPLSAAALLTVWIIYGMLCARIEVLFFDVGQGLGSLVTTSDGIAGLVDTGTGNVDIYELLKKEGVRELDFIVLSHGHNDHYGGLADLLENIKPKVVYVPKNELDEYLPELSSKYDLNVTFVDREAKLQLGKYTLMEMYEPENAVASQNNGSLIVRLSGAWGSILLPGDAEEEEQSEMTERGICLSADVLCLGHHGSITSGGEKFLCEVNPKYGIISVGHNNSYGHPSSVVLNRLSEMGVLNKNVYRTDRDGAVRVECGNRLFGKGFIKIWQKRMRVA